jgi:hypothetical protein
MMNCFCFTKQGTKTLIQFKEMGKALFPTYKGSITRHVFKQCAASSVWVQRRHCKVPTKTRSCRQCNYDLSHLQGMHGKCTWHLLSTILGSCVGLPGRVILSELNRSTVDSTHSRQNSISPAVLEVVWTTVVFDHRDAKNWTEDASSITCNGPRTLLKSVRHKSCTLCTKWFITVPSFLSVCSTNCKWCIHFFIFMYPIDS